MTFGEKLLSLSQLASGTAKEVLLGITGATKIERVFVCTNDEIHGGIEVNDFGADIVSEDLNADMITEDLSTDIEDNSLESDQDEVLSSIESAEA